MSGMNSAAACQKNVRWSSPIALASSPAPQMMGNGGLGMGLGGFTNGLASPYNVADTNMVGSGELIRENSGVYSDHHEV